MIIGFDQLKTWTKIWKIITMVAKISQNGTLAKDIVRATDLNPGKYTQYDSGSICCVPPGHTTLHRRVRLKMPKMLLRQNACT